MKRIILIIFVIAILLSMSSSRTANDEFTFRGSRFGDSMEQVRKAEGDEGETDEEGDYQNLCYEREIYRGYSGPLHYSFKDNELKLILGIFSYSEQNNIEHIEDVYQNVKEMFLGYGQPTKEESLEYKMYQALWKRDGYGIALLVMDNAIIIACSSYPDRAERFYSTYSYSGLFDDFESSSTNRHITGLDFYNDPYDISSFIPVPKEGCDYIVRNSIREEELSIFKERPSMQRLISSFGYPPIAVIDQDIINDNGDYEWIKEYRLIYYIDGNKLSVIYDEDCNFIKANYNKSIADIPEANGDLDIGKPIGIVRNDITRDELSFIDSKTTPEELQDVLGAPHRECYNGELFRRTGFDFIRFFMSLHFLYPIKDGGVLDVHYSIGKDKDELGVSTASIYEDNGERTVLVDYD